MERALAGDPAAMRLCMEHILPRGKARPVPLPLPTVTSAADLPAATATILGAVGAGAITPSEAQQLVKLLESVAKLLDLASAAERLARLEPMVEALMLRQMRDARFSEARWPGNTSEEQGGRARPADERQPERPRNTSEEQAEPGGAINVPSSVGNAAREQTGTRAAQAESRTADPWAMRRPLHPAQNTSAEQAARTAAMQREGGGDHRPRPPGWSDAAAAR